MLRSDEVKVTAINACQSELSRIRELTQSGRYGDALSAIAALAPDVLEHRDAIFLRAVNERCLHRVADALRTLERLEQQHARFGRLHQERGHCHAMLGRRQDAIAAFARAVQINPTLANSWRMLEQLHRQERDFKQAALALGQLATLQRQPSEVIRAASQFSDGDLKSAEAILRAYLSSAPGELEARCLLVQILLRAQRFADARANAEALLAMNAENRQVQSLCAAACAGLGDHQTAIALYEAAVARGPAAPETHVLIGHSLRASARPQQAIGSYRAALALRPNFGDAFWSLANLKTYRFSNEEVALMLAGADEPTTALVDRYHLCFALGRAFEMRGEYARAWHYYQRGNALKRSEFRYRSDLVTVQARRQAEVCTADFLAVRGGVGAPDPDPIFVVGLPRSGSTLIEQILASHSRVEGTQELAEISRLVSELHPYPQALADMAPGEFRALGERYLSESQAYRRERTQGKVRFIDKMPNNFWHLGLIHLILPNAKIIDVRREPVACCFSNFKQLYASGQEFSYGLETVAHYYRTYLQLMKHWDDVLAGALLRVQFEDVVNDLEGSARRMLEFCGLDFEPGCLNFHETRRSVSSASSEQVRRPIFQQGLTDWRNFEPHLTPLKDALGDALTETAG
jgi:tetratricopeptide (TPR) repeat protein